MRIKYCVPTLNQHQRLPEIAAALQRSTLRPVTFAIVDNSGEAIVRDMMANKELAYDKLEVHYPDDNLGCAGGWNYFLSKYDHDYLIIANDDVLPDSHTIATLIAGVIEGEKEGKVFFHGDVESGNSFSFFCLTLAGYEQVGPFDEGFWPAYFEDNDYHRRLRLIGKDIHCIRGATFTHIGSATMNSLPEAQQTWRHNMFRKNQGYYIRKWGAMPGQELYSTPFNK